MLNLFNEMMEHLDEYGYNGCDEHPEFKDHWSLGSDDGHMDFCEWLVSDFKPKYPEEYGHIISCLDQPHNKWIYFALEKYKPKRSRPKRSQPKA